MSPKVGRRRRLSLQLLIATILASGCWTSALVGAAGNGDVGGGRHIRLIRRALPGRDEGGGGTASAAAQELYELAGKSAGFSDDTWATASNSQDPRFDHSAADAEIELTGPVFYLYTIDQWNVAHALWRHDQEYHGGESLDIIAPTAASQTSPLPSPPNDNNRTVAATEARGEPPPPTTGAANNTGGKKHEPPSSPMRAGDSGPDDGAPNDDLTDEEETPATNGPVAEDSSPKTTQVPGKRTFCIGHEDMMGTFNWFCQGPAMTSVPHDLLPKPMSLQILNTGLETLTQRSLPNYKDTLRDFSIENAPRLKSIEPGTFAELIKLRVVYIIQAPKLVSFDYAVSGLHPELTIIRIQQTGLMHWPNFSGFKQERILSSVDLDNNKIATLGSKPINIRTELLNLEFNYITSIDELTFANSEIGVLSLSGNRQLSFIHPNAFAELKNLIKLYPQTHDPSAYEEHLRHQAAIYEFCTRKRLAEIKEQQQQQQPQQQQQQQQPAQPTEATAAAAGAGGSSTAIPEFVGFFDESERKIASHSSEPESPPLLPPSSSSSSSSSTKSSGASDAASSPSPAPLPPTQQNQVSPGGDSTSSRSPHLQAEQGPRQDQQQQPSQQLQQQQQQLLLDNKTRIVFESQTNGSKVYFTQTVECGELAVKYGHFQNISCTPEPDAFNPCEDIMGYFVLRVAVWFVVGASVFGNLSVIVVLAGVFRRLSVPKFLQLNLAIGDLFMGVYLAMLAFADLTTVGAYFNYAIDWQHGYGCKIAGAASLFASQLSIYTLSVITFERYYTITYSIDLNMRLQLGWAARIMLVGWLYAFTSAMLPIFADTNSYSKTSICLPMRTTYLADRLFIFILLAIDTSAFVIIFACYLKMYLLIIRQKTEATAKERTVAMRMALLVFTDFACWAPIIFFGTTALFGRPLISVTNSKILIVFFYPLNSMANPFLYVISTRQYRRDLNYLTSRWHVWRKNLFKKNKDDSYYAGNNAYCIPQYPGAVNAHLGAVAAVTGVAANHLRHNCIGAPGSDSNEAEFANHRRAFKRAPDNAGGGDSSNPVNGTGDTVERHRVVCSKAHQGRYIIRHQILTDKNALGGQAKRCARTAGSSLAMLTLGHSAGGQQRRGSKLQPPGNNGNGSKSNDDDMDNVSKVVNVSGAGLTNEWSQCSGEIDALPVGVGGGGGAGDEDATRVRLVCRTQLDAGRHQHRQSVDSATQNRKQRNGACCLRRMGGAANGTGHRDSVCSEDFGAASCCNKCCYRSYPGQSLSGASGGAGKGAAAAAAAAVRRPSAVEIRQVSNPLNNTSEGGGSKVDTLVTMVPGSNGTTSAVSPQCAQSVSSPPDQQCVCLVDDVFKDSFRPRGDSKVKGTMVVKAAEPRLMMTMAAAVAVASGRGKPSAARASGGCVDILGNLSSYNEPTSSYSGVSSPPTSQLDNELLANEQSSTTNNDRHLDSAASFTRYHRPGHHHHRHHQQHRCLSPATSRQYLQQPSEQHRNGHNNHHQHHHHRCHSHHHHHHHQHRSRARRRQQQGDNDNEATTAQAAAQAAGGSHLAPTPVESDNDNSTNLSPLDSPSLEAREQRCHHNHNHHRHGHGHRRHCHHHHHRRHRHHRDHHYHHDRHRTCEASSSNDTNTVSNNNNNNNSALQDQTTAPPVDPVVTPATVNGAAPIAQPSQSVESGGAPTKRKELESILKRVTEPASVKTGQTAGAGARLASLLRGSSFHSSSLRDNSSSGGSRQTGSRKEKKRVSIVMAHHSG